MIHPKLPEMCAIYNRANGKPVFLKNGSVGYWPADTLDTAEKVQEFNQAHKADAACLAAMEMGSMVGFHVPGADPDLWREDGKLRHATEKFAGIAYREIR